MSKPMCGVSARGFLYRTDTGVLPSRSVNGITLLPSGTNGDNCISKLWLEYQKRYSRSASMSMTLRLTKRLAELIGDLDTYLYHQVTSKQSNEYVIDFLKDTIRFTQLGYRKYPLSVWKELLESGEEPCSYETDIFNDTHIPTIEELLSNWCATEQGLDDMFFTAFILFGN